MKIFHIADTHLGRAQFNRLDPDTGLNLREKLFYDNFLDSIDHIIRMRPDAVVHAGDLFDHVKPKTRAYTTVLEALDRLNNAGLPFIVIAGNHSMAKTRYTTSPFRVLEYHRSEVYAAYNYRYRRVETGDAVFHLIPNMLQADHYREEFEKISYDTGLTNVLVTHGLASTIRDRRLNTVSEHEIDSTMLSDRFGYIALGHYHGQSRVADNAWYSGSIEYCNYGEINEKKGGLLVDLAKGDVKSVHLPKTPMINLGNIDCSDLKATEIECEIAGRISGIEDTGSHVLCQITLERILRETMREMDRRKLQEARERVLDLKIRSNVEDTSGTFTEEGDLRAVDYIGEFGEFLKKQNLDMHQHRFVSRKGSEVLRKVIEARSEG